jgi:hypothetical protein
MATIYEMAKLAGVSPATVSRAFTVVRLPAWHIGMTAARMLLDASPGMISLRGRSCSAANSSPRISPRAAENRPSRRSGLFHLGIFRACS